MLYSEYCAYIICSSYALLLCLFLMLSVYSLFHVLRGVLKAKSAFIKRRVAAEPLSHSERLPTIIEPPKVFQQQAEQSTEIHPFVDPET